MAKPVMNLDEVEFDDVEENGRFTSSRGQIGRHIGARDLGYNLTVLPPGKVQCPFHSHHGEEEMFLILEGEGELRFGDQRYPIRKHDVIACPTGGPEVAHQIINTGTAGKRGQGVIIGAKAAHTRPARRLKMLVGKPGLDDHSNGAEQIAVAARDSGIEVVYEGIRLTPARNANKALEEGVHIVGLSILSGSHIAAGMTERREASTGLPSDTRM